ncbi:MAG: hypothetical protein ACRDA3_00590 [Peptostreptococcaceae bacterium]
MKKIITLLFHIGVISLITYSYLYFTDNIEALKHPIFMIIGITFSTMAIMLSGLYIYFEKSDNINIE